MEVFYLTVKFPAPSEAFAGTEVRSLRNAGVDISVHSLRKVGEERQRLLREWDLLGLVLSYPTNAGFIKGFFEGVKRPFLLFDLLSWIIFRLWNNPVHLIKSLIFVPRTLELFAEIEKRRPDVVHLFWGHHPALVGRLVKRYCPQIVVSMFLGAYDLRDRKNGCSSQVAQEADVLWTHADSNVKSIQALGVSSHLINVSRRGVDLENCKKNNVLKVKQRIITIGRLHKLKGMDGVLKVFRGVLDVWPYSSLVVLGDGPERKNLEDLANSLGLGASVEFKGQVSHGQVFEELLKSEVFVFMSLTECLPNVVKEAMACRCLCVITETLGIEELVEDSKTGFLVPWDVNVVVDKVNKIFENPSLYDQVLENAREHIFAKFNAAENLDKYIDVWSELVEKKSSG